MFTKDIYKFDCRKYVLEKHIDINNIEKSYNIVKTKTPSLF